MAIKIPRFDYPVKFRFIEKNSPVIFRCKIMQTEVSSYPAGPSIEFYANLHRRRGKCLQTYLTILEPTLPNFFTQ